MNKILFIVTIIVIGIIFFLKENKLDLNKPPLVQASNIEKPESSGSIYSLSVNEVNELTSRGNAGDAEAAFKLYKFYTFSTENIEKRRYWLEAAANTGKTIAQYNLAVDYFNAKNFNESKKWAMIAQTNGDKSAQKLLLEIEVAEKNK